METKGWILRAYDGREHGPVSLSTLKRWINENRADRDSLVLPPGETRWRPVRECPELSSIVGDDISELIEKNKKLQDELSEISKVLQKEREEKKNLEEKLKEKETLLMERISEPPVAKEELTRKIASLEKGTNEQDIFSHHMKMILTLYDIIKQTERDIVSELQSLLSQIKMEKLKREDIKSGKFLLEQGQPPVIEKERVTDKKEVPLQTAPRGEERLINIFLVIVLFLMICLLGYILTKYFIL